MWKYSQNSCLSFEVFISFVWVRLGWICPRWWWPAWWQSRLFVSQRWAGGAQTSLLRKKLQEVFFRKPLTLITLTNYVKWKWTSCILSLCEAFVRKYKIILLIPDNCCGWVVSPTRGSYVPLALDFNREKDHLSHKRSSNSMYIVAWAPEWGEGRSQRQAKTLVQGVFF